jgi:hypothetical protein
MAITARQKRRIRRTQEAARELREVQSQHHSLIPAQVRQPDYWRDLSIEIAGTILSAAMIFSFGRMLGYIERPSVRSEILRTVGVTVIALAVAFVWIRARRVRANHPGASNDRLVGVYLRAIELQWSLPALAVGVALCLGYV